MRNTAESGAERKKDSRHHCNDLLVFYIFMMKLNWIRTEIMTQFKLKESKVTL